MNSALVEFEDGTKVVTSRYAVRKLIHNAEVTGRPLADGPVDRRVMCGGRDE